MFQNAIVRAEKSDDVKQRVQSLIDSITYMVFMYTSRGLFERDKLIFTSQVTFQVRFTRKDLYSYIPTITAINVCILLSYIVS